MAFDYREVVGALKPKTMDERKALFVSQFKPSNWLSNLFIHPVVIVVVQLFVFKVSTQLSVEEAAPVHKGQADQPA